MRHLPGQRELVSLVFVKPMGEVKEQDQAPRSDAAMTRIRLTRTSSHRERGSLGKSGGYLAVVATLLWILIVQFGWSLYLVPSSKRRDLWLNRSN